MNSRKVREILSVSFLIIFVVAIIGAVSIVSKNIFYSLKPDGRSYVLKDIVNLDLPVVNEVENKILKPFNDEQVNIQVSFYSLDDEKDKQERSLIEYDDTYMPSTGILYASDQAFDILASSQGTVENIEDNEIFGTIITIRHNNNLTTKYSSVKEPLVKVGDTVNPGEIIAKSGINKITSVSENMLLFEIIYDGQYVNPENYYDKVIEEMN